MKTMTVLLTDEQAELIEATARNKGVSPDDVLHDAVSTYLREFPRRESETPKPFGFIGIGASGRSDTASRMDEILAEEWAHHLLHDEVSYPDPSPSERDPSEPGHPDHDRIGESA